MIHASGSESERGICPIERFVLTLAIVASSSEDDFQTPKSKKERFLEEISSQLSPERVSSVGPSSSSMGTKSTGRSQSVDRLGMIGLTVLPLTRENENKS